MLDIGWSELLLIGIVALIVVGPKDLPKMFRTFGQFVGKARGMAREFQRAMEQAADESGVKDMARDLRNTVSGKDMGVDALKDLPRNPKTWVKDTILAGEKSGRNPAPAGPAAAAAAGKPTTSAPSAATPPPADPEQAADLADTSKAQQPARPAQPRPGPAFGDGDDPAGDTPPRKDAAS